MSNNQVVYKIRADGKGYVRTLQKMRGDTKKFGNDVKGEMTGISGAIKGAFAFAGVSGLRSITQEFANMSRQAKMLGVNAVEFQKLSRVAGQFGLTSENLGDAIKDLNVKITDGALGAKSYAEVFALVGLNMEEVKKMTPTEQFYAFSDAVKATGGNLSRFGLDEINDQMFRAGEMASLGSEKIKEMAASYNVLSQSQLDSLEFAERGITNLTDKFKIMVGEIMSKYAQMAKELGIIFDKLNKQAGGDSKSLPRDMSKDYDFEFGKGYTLKSKPEEKGKSDQGSGITDPEKEKEAIKKASEARAEILKEEAKQKAEQEKRIRAILDDEEKLLRIQNEKLKIEAEMASLGERLFKDGATAEESLKLAQMQTKWEKLQTEEQAKQLEISEKKQIIDEANIKRKDAQIKRDKEATEANKKDIAETSQEREELGMTDKEILARREKELAQKEQDLIASQQRDSTDVMSEADVAKADKLKSEKELEIENLKKEIKGLKGGISEKAKGKVKEAEAQESEIAAERKRREEMGMSDEEILARRKSELAQAEEAFAALGEDANNDGKVDEDDEIFRNKAELDIERRKSEIKGLEQGLQPGDPQAGVIASSLAAIGGGGGVASFGNDPMLNENKKQTTVLEGIKQAIENQNRGEEVLLTPEL